MFENAIYASFTFRGIWVFRARYLVKTKHQFKSISQIPSGPENVCHLNGHSVYLLTADSLRKAPKFPQICSLKFCGREGSN